MTVKELYAKLRKQVDTSFYLGADDAKKLDVACGYIEVPAEEEEEDDSGDSD